MAGVLAIVQRFGNGLGVGLIGPLYFGMADDAVAACASAGGFDVALIRLVALAVPSGWIVRRLPP